MPKKGDRRERDERKRSGTMRWAGYRWRNFPLSRLNRGQ